MALKDKVKDTLKNKKIKDLEDLPKADVETAPIDPTPAMIIEVVEALRAGTDLRTIQLEITVGKRILSMEQIKIIKSEIKKMHGITENPCIILKHQHTHSLALVLPS